MVTLPIRPPPPGPTEAPDAEEPVGLPEAEAEAAAMSDESGPDDGAATASTETPADPLPPANSNAAAADLQPAVAVVGHQEESRLVVRLDGLTAAMAPEVTLVRLPVGAVEVHGLDIRVGNSTYALRWCLLVAILARMGGARVMPMCGCVGVGALCADSTPALRKAP